ncbi:MAG: 3-methyl-2-oxobutanoate hydroxymethyltransferase [Cellvibrionales bacterium]|nr:3-methyl-2-oxobutanoate hydroxymethyltransferase [Cellvibrionales bacterium]
MRSIIPRLIAVRNQRPMTPGIKVNLYRGYEYQSLINAMNATNLSVECVMVGDSYYMTHLGLPSTQLNEAQKAESISLLPELVNEVYQAIKNQKNRESSPFLMADMPGSLSLDQEEKILDLFKLSGAVSVKFEPVDEANCKRLIQKVRTRKMLPTVHLGYKPQVNDNQLYGSSYEAIETLKLELLKLKELGAECVIFERISEIANQILSQFAVCIGLLPYSIFSGKACFGGQSLNIWDSTVKPEKTSIFFPPTACLVRDDVEQSYNEQCIETCISQLLTLTASQLFPPSPRNSIPLEEQLRIASAIVDGDEWEYHAKHLA